MAVVETKLITQPRGGGEHLEELPAEIIRYGYRLNRPGAIRFTLDLDHEKAVRANLEEGVHEALVERNAADVWVGPVVTVDEDDDARTLDVAGEGLMSYLRRWFVTSTLNFVTTEQFTIARDLIKHHQDKAGGDFGIDVSAVTTSGILRDRTYQDYEHKNIYDALVQLSEVRDGFDFAFNADTRALDLFFPRKGQRRTDIVFDVRNIRRFRRRRDGTGQASQVIGIGTGEEENMLIKSSQDSGAVAKYGLTQRIITHKDVSVAKTLEDHVADALNAFKRVPNVLSIEVGTKDPVLFSYQLGDEVKVRWDSPYAKVNEFQRIIGFDVIWTKGEETAVLHLEPLI